MAALLLFAILILASTGRSSATWCVCKNGLSDASLQKTLDYACGAGADCNPIHQTGACYNPNTVQSHCSYAVNSYFQKKGQAAGSCDFSGTASVSTSDPSYTGCAFPASASSSGTPTTTTTTTTPPSTTTPSTYTPNVPPTTTTPPYSITTPGSGGILGGVGTGLGPSGAGMNSDISEGISMVPGPALFIYLFASLAAGLMMMN